MLTFSTQERLAAKLKKPKEITSYSITGGKVSLDSSNLKYYYLPEETILKSPISLVSGVDNWEQPHEPATHLDTLLEALVASERASGEKTAAQVITWRGILTKIMTHPYDHYREPIELNVEFFDGQVFVEEDWDLRQAARDPAKDASMKRAIYSGYKFETVALIDEPWPTMSRSGIDTRDSQIPTGDQYVSVVRTGIGNNAIVIGGEVDCVFDPSAKGLARYGELKTTREVCDERDAAALEQKMCKAWAQSFLIGIKHIIYGFRNRDFQLAAVDYFKTDDLPVFVAASNAPGKWSGSDCINFLNYVITQLVEQMPKTEGKVWRLRFDHDKKEATLSELPGAKSFLSDDFVSWRKELAAK